MAWPTATFTPNTLADADAVTAAIAAIASYGDANAVLLSGSQTLTGAKTFTGGVAVNTTGLTIGPQTAITFSHASARIVPGATGLYFRDTANAADNLAITNAGAVTIRAGLTVTAGGFTVTAGGLTVTAGGATITAGDLTVTAGNIVFAAAAARLIPGATSFSLRNNANSADNVLVTDGGVVTVRSHLNVTGAIGGNGSSAVLINATTVTIQNSSGLITLGTAGGGTGSTADVPKMPAVSGTPTGAVADGAFLLDSTNHLLYVRSGGAWKSTALT